MANHSQRPQKELMKCSACKKNQCEKCMDVTRRQLFGESFEPLCSCTRQNHDALVRGEGVSTPYGAQDNEGYNA